MKHIAPFILIGIILPFGLKAQEKGVLRLMLQANANNGTLHRATEQSDPIMEPLIYSDEEYTGDGEEYSKVPPGYMLGAGLSYSVGYNSIFELSYARSISYYAFELNEPYYFYFDPFDMWIGGWLWWQEYDIYKFRYQFGFNSIADNLYGALGVGAIGQTSRFLLTERTGMGNVLENEYLTSPNYTGGRWTSGSGGQGISTFIAPEIGYCFYTNAGHLISMGISYTKTFQSTPLFGYEHYVDGRRIADAEYIIDGSNISFDVRYGFQFKKFTRNRQPKEPKETPQDELLVEERDHGLNTDVYAPINLTILLDASGSMAGEKMDAVKQGMVYLLDSLRSIDHFSLVVFNDESEVITSSQQVNPGNKTLLKDEVMQLSAGGSTYGGNGLKKAYKIARDSYIPDGKNYIIIITDGNFNDPKFSNEKLEKLIGSNLQKNDLHLSIIGIDNNEGIANRLTYLAELGEGTYVSVANIDELETRLLQEVKAITILEFWSK